MVEAVRYAARKPAFWVCLSLTIAFLTAGFLAPPLAHIDGSVLTACGIMFAFATLEVVHVAIHKGVDARVRHGNTELTVGDLDNKGEQDMKITDDNEPDYE